MTARRSTHVRSLFAALWAGGAFEELTGPVVGRRCHVPHWSFWLKSHPVVLVANLDG